MVTHFVWGVACVSLAAAFAHVGDPLLLCLLVHLIAQYLPLFGLYFVSLLDLCEYSLVCQWFVFSAGSVIAGSLCLIAGSLIAGSVCLIFVLVLGLCFD